jgi:hypothetical protein
VLVVLDYSSLSPSTRWSTASAPGTMIRNFTHENSFSSRPKRLAGLKELQASLEVSNYSEANYSRSRSSAGSAPRAPASLRIVEKRGSTSFLSILTSCLREIPAARASSSWVVNL